jgi:carbon-monoxide dehydrogenase large subunit
MGTSILGSRVLRVEDPPLLTGEADYAEDVPVEGAAHAVFVRSFVAHGRVVGIDANGAASMPGVLGIFTASDVDLPPMWTSGAIPEAFARPILAAGVVRFVGEPVAVVVAETRAQAIDAAEDVVLDLDPFPAVVDPDLASAPDAPILFQEIGSNVAMRFDTGVDPSLFDGADVVVRRRVVAPALAPTPLEVNSITARPDRDTGGLTVWASIQDAFSMRGRLADSLGVDPGTIRVVASHVGGGFGAKIETYPEHVVVAWLASRLNRPVRWVETRSESLTAMTLGRARISGVSMGGTRDGRIVGLSVDIVADSGAYPGLNIGQSLLTYQMATGPYRIPKLRFSITNVVTNTTPKAAYRGAGRPEATQFIELAMDALAAELGMDPAELRRRNFPDPETFPHSTQTGAEYDSGEYGAALAEALRLAGYDDVRAEQATRREHGSGPLLGVGICSYVEVTAVGPLGEFASVSVDADDGFLVTAGTGPTGQGHETAFAQVAAATLGVPVESVRVVLGDTGPVERGEGTYGSRSLQLGGTAVHRAAERVVEKAKRIAGHVLEVAPEDIVVDDGRFAVAGAPDRSVTWQ